MNDGSWSSVKGERALDINWQLIARGKIRWYG